MYACVFVRVCVRVRVRKPRVPYEIGGHGKKLRGGADGSPQEELEKERWEESEFQGPRALQPVKRG